MTKLEHDPRTKQQIKDALYDYLYTPVQNYFQTRIQNLIIRNTLLGGYSHRHFIYKAVVYNCDTTPPPTRKNRLQSSLRDQMEEYLADVHELNNKELPYVLGFINQVLNSSCDLGDYKKLLPDSVHYPLDHLIASCPCRTSTLNPDRIDQLKARNQESIDMIKQRLVMNLLL